MTDTHQDALIVTQFGPRAAAYVESATHSQGEDLKRLAQLAAGWSGKRVLDLGCGGGHATFAVARHVSEVVAYDLSRDMLAAVDGEGKRRGLNSITTHQGTVESLSFGDGEFDAVITRFSLHHWNDLPVALKEARRVVKANAPGIFMDTVSPAHPALDTFLQALELFRDPSHVRNYSEGEFRSMLEKASFKVTGVTLRRLPLNFDAWIKRMNTPAIQAEAIRAVQRQVAADTKRYFCVAEDGSFEIDTVSIETVAA